MDNPYVSLKSIHFGAMLTSQQTYLASHPHNLSTCLYVFTTIALQKARWCMLVQNFIILNFLLHSYTGVRCISK